MAGFIEALREGSWLIRERMRFIARLLLAAAVIGAGFLITTSDGRRPLGTDFSNVYTAGSYVPPEQYAREQAIFGKDTPFYGNLVTPSRRTSRPIRATLFI